MREDGSCGKDQEQGQNQVLQQQVRQQEHRQQPEEKDPVRQAGALALQITLMAVAEDGAGRRRRNPKRSGEMSQAAFLLKAQSLGFGLAVPWGDSEKCDFIVWAGPGGRLLRVQVKATGRLNGGGYDVQPVYSTRHEGKKCYTAQEIDVLAAHVQGLDVWYLLPVEAIAGAKNLRLFPGLKGRDPRWEGYREAWEWLGREG